MPGDVVAIPLGDGLFGFGRVYRDASIGIFDLVAPRIPLIGELEKVSERFVAGAFSTAIHDGSWSIIGRIPFLGSNDEWPPPKRVNDVVNPSRVKIYHLGAIRSATPDEVEGLEVATMSKPEQLVDRIRAELLGEGKASVRLSKPPPDALHRGTPRSPRRAKR